MMRLLSWLPLAVAVTLAVVTWFSRDEEVRQAEMARAQTEAAAIELCKATANEYFAYYRQGQADPKFDLEGARKVLADCIARGRSKHMFKD